MSALAEILKMANQQFDAAFNSKNAQAIGDLYAADAVVLPAPAGQPVVGQGAIVEFFAGLITAGVIEHQLTMSGLVTSDKLATQFGTWAAALIGEDGVKQQFGGNVQVVYQQQAGGRWLAVTHIWN